MKKTRDRSPSYPAVGLRRAGELTQQLWEEFKGQPIPITKAVGTWGYGSKSSGGHLMVAALKKYGLVEEQGSKETRRIKLTPLALELVNPSSSNISPHMREAALKPSIHAELWDKFGQQGRPDDMIKTFLVYDRKFTPEAADNLIEQFRETMTFAGLAGNAAGGSTVTGTLSTKREFVVPLASGDARITLTTTQDLEARDLDAVIGYLELFKKQLS